MDLKRLSNLEIILFTIIDTILIPLYLTYFLINALYKMFRYLIDKVIALKWFIGNKLLKSSDEVKNGIIRNKSYIESCTASNTYKHYIKGN